MTLCSSLLARWRRFLGRMPPTHAALFQLLLLALLAANIAGVVLTVRRLQHSYAAPTPVMSQHSLTAPPTFSVALLPSSGSNVSISCSQEWPGGALSCPRLQWSESPDGDSTDTFIVIAGTPTFRPFSAGDPYWLMEMTLSGMVDDECIGVQVLGVPLADVTPANFQSLSSLTPPSSVMYFCPRFVSTSAGREAESFVAVAELSFSALEDTHAHVNYSVGMSVLEKMQKIAAEPQLQMLVDLEGKLQVPWITQEYAYTYMDALASIFAYANMSFAVVAFLFPWRYVGEHIREERQFKLGCDGKKSDDASEHVINLEGNSSSSRHLQERMLSEAPLSSPLPVALDPAFERALRQMVAEWRGASARSGTEQR